MSIITVNTKLAYPKNGKKQELFKKKSVVTYIMNKEKWTKFVHNNNTNEGKYIFQIEKIKLDRK